MKLSRLGPVSLNTGQPYRLAGTILVEWWSSCHDGSAAAC
jgi:hypothetical protein